MEPQPLSGKKLLVVEDDKGLRRAITFMLAQVGHEVILAQDGEEALSLIATHHPDLVLLDLIIPKINGFEVLRRMKADPETADIPVVCFSNLSQDNDKEQVLGMGAVEFVTKADISVEQILGIVSKYLG
jgi:two-component system, OmpR family, alkaline phosphatase synthesis response regulator PhoP